MNAKLIVVLVLFAAALLFIIQNASVVEIRFLFWSIQMSRSIWMILLLGAGIVIGWFLPGWLRHRRGRTAR